MTPIAFRRMLLWDYGMDLLIGCGWTASVKEPSQTRDPRSTRPQETLELAVSSLEVRQSYFWIIMFVRPRSHIFSKNYGRLYCFMGPSDLCTNMRIWVAFLRGLSNYLLCGFFSPLSVIKAYEVKKRLCRFGSKYRINSSIPNGEIFSLQTNFCTELEQFWCSPSADFTCKWNSSLRIKCHVFLKFVFLHQRWCGPKKSSGKRTRLGVLTWLALAYFFTSVAS